MVDLGEDEDKFDAFMLPLTTAFESLGAVLAAGGYNSEEVEHHSLILHQALQPFLIAGEKNSYRSCQGPQGSCFCLQYQG